MPNLSRYRHLAVKEKGYFYFLKLKGETHLVHRKALNASDKAKLIWVGLYEGEAAAGEELTLYEQLKARAEADYKKWIQAKRLKKEIASDEEPSPLPYRPEFKTRGGVAKSVKKAASIFFDKETGFSVTLIEKVKKGYLITYSDGTVDKAMNAADAIQMIKKLTTASDEEE